MKLSDIQKIPVLQTKAVSIANEDTNTHLYLIDCYKRMLTGDYGGRKRRHGRKQRRASGRIRKASLQISKKRKA